MEVMTLLRKFKNEVDSRRELDCHDGNDENDYDEDSDDDLSYQHEYIADMIKFKKQYRQLPVQISDANDEWDLYHNSKHMQHVNLLQKDMTHVRKKAKKVGALLLKSNDDIELFPDQLEDDAFDDNELERVFSCDFHPYEFDLTFSTLTSESQKNEIVTDITTLDNKHENMNLERAFQNDLFTILSSSLSIKEKEKKNREVKLRQLITSEFSESILISNDNQNNNENNNSADVANEEEQNAYDNNNTSNTISVVFSFQTLTKNEPEITNILRRPQYSNITDIKVQPTFLISNNNHNENEDIPATVFTGEPKLKRYIHGLEMIYPWSTMITSSRVTELIPEMKHMIPDKKQKNKKKEKKKNNNNINNNTEQQQSVHRNLAEHAKDFNSKRRIKMNFVRVEKNDSIIMKIVDKEYMIKFEQLQQKMNLYYSVVVKKLEKERIKLEDVRNGLVVGCCVSVEHGMFARTKILKWNYVEEDSEITILVQSVDDEKSYTVKVENLFYLHDEFLDLPFLVNAYHLNGHEFFSGTGLIYENFEEIIKTTTEFYGDVTTTREKGSNVPKLVSNLFIGNDSNPQKAKLTNVNHEFLHYLLGTLKQSVPDDNMEQGFLSRWSEDGSFWFHKKNRILDKVLNHFLNSDYSIFNDLQQETLSSISEDFVKDQMYVARRPEDNHFYRGKILEIYYAENLILMEFVDLGVSEIIKISSIYNVKQIDSTLEIIPPQCFKQVLSGWKQSSSNKSTPFKEKIPVLMKMEHSRDSNGFIASSLRVVVVVSNVGRARTKKLIPLEKYFAE